MGFTKIIDIRTQEELKDISYNDGTITKNKIWIGTCHIKETKDLGYFGFLTKNNFNIIMSGNFLEIEFHPNTPDTMYFIRQSGDVTEFYRSDDGGNSLTLYTNGWPNPSSGDEQKRTEIAVSPAAPNKIVALATGSANGGSGLYGIYISYDKGENWIFQCCGPYPAGVPDTNNIIKQDCAGVEPAVQDLYH